jgi:hypothetical protein
MSDIISFDDMTAPAFYRNLAPDVPIAFKSDRCEACSLRAVLDRNPR